MVFFMSAAICILISSRFCSSTYSFLRFWGTNTHFSASVEYVDTFCCNTCTYFSSLIHLLLCFCYSSIYTVGSEGCGKFSGKRIRLLQLTFFPHVFLSIISSFFHKCSCSLRTVRRHRCRGILPRWVLLHYGVPHLYRMLKIGSLDSLTLLSLANFTNSTLWSEDPSYSLHFSFLLAT